jgi:prophage antirepressor-like protein
MPDLIPFHFGNHEISVQLDEQGNPWWIAREVCEVLQIRNVSNAVGRLLQGEKGIRSTDNLLIINESGLYRLIFRSDKPEALAFQTWVFEEVLPQIRKTGKYEATPQRPQVKNPAHQLIIDAVIRLDAVEQQVIEVQREAAQTQANLNRAFESQIFFTVAEYVHHNKLQRQVPESAYRALSKHLSDYCQEHNIPFRRIPIGGKRWESEYGFHISVYTDVLPGWLRRNGGQGNLHMLPPPS